MLNARLMLAKVLPSPCSALVTAMRLASRQLLLAAADGARDQRSLDVPELLGDLALLFLRRQIAGCAQGAHVDFDEVE